MAVKSATPPDMEGFKRILKSKKLKATPQRLAVHEVMLDLGHASADMVCDRIRSRGGSVTVASVYNILSQLALLGIYSHRLSPNSKMYFDVNTGRHIHLFDTVNSEFRDIMDEEFVSMAESYFRKKRFSGYKVDSVEVQLLCHPTKKSR